MVLGVSVKGVDCMEKIMLAIIGVTAVCFVVRLLWKEAKGELPCNCAQKSCNKNCKTKK